LLMAGGIGSHARVGDLRHAGPAALLFVLSAVTAGLLVAPI
ncbi:MAG: hypothetical protein QOF25_72, partial [Mycobacterium sp.]|nr:hypothetical protein [Mycobacterium sp.]